MALTKIKPSRITDTFISEEPVGNLCVVCVSATDRKIKLSTDATPELIAGVNIGSLVLSGQPARVVTHGEVSGLICAAAVTAGDRVTGAISGRVTPINTITPTGSILLTSGSMTSGATSGYVGVEGIALINPGGLVSATGFQGTAFNTQRVLGKALDTGAGAGSGIRVLVAIGG
jgi:hypothetical protein